MIQAARGLRPSKPHWWPEAFKHVVNRFDIACEDRRALATTSPFRVQVQRACADASALWDIASLADPRASSIDTMASVGNTSMSDEGDACPFGAPRITEV